MSKNASQRIIFILQTYPFKSAQKNILKACNVTTNKLCHKCCDNDLKKIFQANILEKGTEKKVLIAVLFQMEIVY